MLVLYALLELAERDRAWIEAVRAQHDPQAPIIAAHFTLVFPFDGGEEAQIAAHAAAVVTTTPAIAFRLTAARAIRDPLAPRSLVFLLPEEGEEEIRQLHAALYTGPLASHLRTDLPFHPHVTVAGHHDHLATEALAAELAPIDIPGRLHALELAAFDGRLLTPRHRLPLAG